MPLSKLKMQSALVYRLVIVFMVPTKQDEQIHTTGRLESHALCTRTAPVLITNPLALKKPITTAADDFCNIFPNFEKN